MILKKLIGILFTLLLCTHSASANQPQKASSESQAIYSADKTNFLVDPKHPEFTIQLKSNPTTGFSWFLREYDSNLITPIKHQTQKPDSKSLGAPGFETWVFRVKPEAFNVPQQTIIRFIYARPWQGAEGATEVGFHVFTIE